MRHVPQVALRQEKGTGASFWSQTSTSGPPSGTSTSRSSPNRLPSKKMGGMTGSVAPAHDSVLAAQDPVKGARAGAVEVGSRLRADGRHLEVDRRGEITDEAIGMDGTPGENRVGQN